MLWSLPVPTSYHKSNSDSIPPCSYKPPIRQPNLALNQLKSDEGPILPVHDDNARPLYHVFRHPHSYGLDRGYH